MPTLPDILPSQNGTELPEEPRVKIARFGDGYEQRAADGTNADMFPEGTVFWGDLTPAEFTILRDFFRTLGGHTSFDWTPPTETVSRKFVCVRWLPKKQDNGALYDITATFREVPD